MQPSSSDILVYITLLQQSIEVVAKWFDVIKLDVTVDKNEYMVSANNKHRRIEEAGLNIKYLEVIIDHKLNFKMHGSDILFMQKCSSNVFNQIN